MSLFYSLENFFGRFGKKHLIEYQEMSLDWL